MPRTVLCPSGHPLQVPAELSGKRIRCPKCGQPLKIPAIIPKLSETPGGTEWAGPTIGEHTRQVLGEYLGLRDDDLAELADKGVI